MSGEIKFKVDPSTIAGYLPAKGDAIIAALVERTTAVNQALQAKIAGVKLQGEILKSHTNKLAGSVRVIATQNDGSKITGGVQAGGGPAYYGEYLEEGRTGPWTIQPKDPKKVLAFMIGGAMFFRKKVVHPGLKAFAFMSGTIEEDRASIIEQLQQAASGAAQ